MHRFRPFIFLSLFALFAHLIPCPALADAGVAKGKASDEDMFKTPIELALAEAEAANKSEPGAEPLEIDFSKEMIRMLGALGAILLLLFATIYVLRRISTQRAFKVSAQTAINIIERRALSPKSTLYLIEFDGKRTLIAESSQGVRTLAFSDKEKEVLEEEAKESEASTSFPSFKDFFKKK